MINITAEQIAIAIGGFCVLRLIEAFFRKIGKSMSERKKKRQEAKLEKYEQLLQELEKRLAQRKNNGKKSKKL